MPQFKSLRLAIATLLLGAMALGQAGGPNIIVSYSFDDDNNATGPDTFRVFNFAKGTVNLTSAYRYGGYRSLELRDVESDKAFPELQGYFSIRKKGKLFAHFAMMTATPDEKFNIALAGPQWFTVQKDGIAFWLSSDAGILTHHSNKVVRKLIPIKAFVWYSVDVVYDINRGTYDLIIHEEGHNDSPAVNLRDQPNAPGEPSSSVDKFSFIGDLEDKSNVVYYVDDIVISTDKPISQKPLIAPGRRKLFVDTWNDSYKKMLKHPNVIPLVDLNDFGIGAPEIASLKQEELMRPLGDLLSGTAFAATVLDRASPNNARLMRAVAFWMYGNTRLSKRESDLALRDFEEAARLAPEGKIFKLSVILALAALKRWEDVDTGLARIYSEWQNDVRFSVACAMVGVSRGNLADAEKWLRDPAELLATDLEDEIIRRLWNGQIDEANLSKLKRAYPNNWRRYVESWLVSEQYFFVLLWQDSSVAAQQYALRMSDRYKKLGLSNWLWLERAGDASFFSRDYLAAVGWYEQSVKSHEENTSALLKLSDVHFLLGDLEKERIYRERIYGSVKRQ